MELWAVGTSSLLAARPAEGRRIIEKHESQGTIDSQEYHDAMQMFNEKHLCALKPRPRDLLQSFSDLLDDPSLYLIMWVSFVMIYWDSALCARNGPPELHVIGSLRNWSIIDELSKIQCNTLVVNGLNDEAQDVAVASFFYHIPKAKWVQLRASTHTPFFEEPDRYFKVVGEFLSSLETRK
ncbi:hypothetical protein C8J57DRAFT_1722379 [Mycena rebaudengoi]|nr:hypothetical protein C8J57DRAFT_1722379 [Mycena rebaudengoi]